MQIGYLPVLEMREHLESLGQLPGGVVLKHLPNGRVNLHHLHEGHEK